MNDGGDFFVSFLIGAAISALVIIILRLRIL